MKIIDIFIKKSNGEETPKRFRYDGQTYIKNSYGAYKDEDGDDLIQNICRDFSNLNDEIEILEEVEDKEYEELEEIKIDYNLKGDMGLDGKYLSENHREILADKINALIRNQKYILEQLNKEGNNE